MSMIRTSMFIQEHNRKICRFSKNRSNGLCKATNRFYSWGMFHFFDHMDQYRSHSCCNSNQYNRLRQKYCIPSRNYSYVPESSILDIPSDHEKRLEHVVQAYSSQPILHTVNILDIPADHEKRQETQPDSIDYKEYTLDISRSDDPRSPIYSYGVFRENEQEDIGVLVSNFTAPALATALRQRENTLQIAAKLASTGDLLRLNELLIPFHKSSVERRRKRKHQFDISSGFTRRELVLLQRYIHRMPRQVAPAVEKRASVVIPLCNYKGVASILFERRSGLVRTYKHQVCFPGGMLDEGVDNTIIQTSLRELEEEVGIPFEKTEVLGIMRCNWQEVASMTGIAVTPVIGFIGEISEMSFRPNRDEVEDLFTVSLMDLLDEKKWIMKDNSAPIFTGGPYVIFGLTAYLLHKFLKDVVQKCRAYNATERESKDNLTSC